MQGGDHPVTIGPSTFRLIYNDQAHELDRGQKHNSWDEIMLRPPFAETKSLWPVLCFGGGGGSSMAN